MMNWSSICDELVFLGAEPTLRGNVIVHTDGVRILVYRTDFDGTEYVGFMAVIAPAAACDPARILTVAPTLASAPVVLENIVSLRHLLPCEVVTLDLARRTIATIAHDSVVFRAALGVREEASSLASMSQYVD